MTERKIVSNATCTFCRCFCDDMELTVENNHITKAKAVMQQGIDTAQELGHPIPESKGRLIYA